VTARLGEMRGEFEVREAARKVRPDKSLGSRVSRSSFMFPYFFVYVIPLPCDTNLRAPHAVTGGGGKAGSVGG